MATIDNYNNIYEILHISPAVYAATETPAQGVDTKGFESVDFIIMSGVVGADGSWLPIIQESDSQASGFTAVVNGTGDDPSHPLLGTPEAFDSTSTQHLWRLGYVGKKRYVRCVLELTGASNATLAVVVQLANPHSAPTSTQS